MSLEHLFAVPPHQLGPPAPQRTRNERGRLEFEMIRRFEGAYPGVHVPRSDAAAGVELRDWLEQSGLAPKSPRWGL